MSETLRDYGERRILTEIIPEFASGVGDDCAEVPTQAATLVMTTDPVPPPAAHIIGGDDDPFWMGWLLVTINASDIAAAGGRPMAFLSALELPPEWPVEQLRRLLSGIRESCDAHGFRYVGGNIKESKQVAATGMAVGDCVGRPALNRSGSLSGDVIISLGMGGRFWSDALRAQAGLEVVKTVSPLFRPVAQSNIVHRLAELGLLNCGMDVSDGLLPTLRELAVKSGNKFVLDMALLPVTSGGDKRLEDGRAWLGWGDWNVISTVTEDKLSEVIRITEALGGSAIPIGSVVSGGSGVSLRRGAVETVAPRLESERFAADSWMTRGIQGYIDELLLVQLP